MTATLSATQTISEVPATGAIAAVTGGTGFLGRFVVGALHDRGFHVRLLARGDPAHEMLSRIPFTTVAGDLDNATALERLVCDAQVVVHAAGLIKAANRRAFDAVNVAGTARLAATIARSAPRARLVYVSSLAAREPRLSAYAASKRAGEQAARAGSGQASCVIVRPPALYGAFDRATLPLFQAFTGPIVPIPARPTARIALLEASDAARAIAGLAAAPFAELGYAGASCEPFELADPNPAGYSWAELVDAAVAAISARPMLIRVPAPAIRLAGLIGSLKGHLGFEPALFSSGKAAELLHGDWSVAIDRLPPQSVWRPNYDIRTGFSAVVRWYRNAGWLA